MGIFDWILLGLIGVFIVTGYRKGLVLSVLGLFSWIISIVVAKMFTPPVVGFFKTTDYYKNIGNSIMQKFEPLRTYTTDTFLGALQNGTIDDKTGLLNNLFSKGVESGKIFDTTTLVSYLATSITDMLVTVICTIVIFILARIVVSFAIKTIKGVVSSLPVVKQFDSLGGILFGFAEGLLIGYVVVMLFLILNVGGISKGSEVGPVVSFFTSFNLMDIVVNNFVPTKK